MANPKFIGPYRITREINRGGQGAILEAVHTKLGHTVAIKVLVDPDDVTYKYFKQEAKILAKLKHPNLLQVTDIGEFQDDITGIRHPYMIMEFIRGRDLKFYMTQGIPKFEWSLKVINTIAKVLEYIHQYGIIHRDLKPANILIEEETKRPVLLDFGLVKKDINAPNKLTLGSLEGQRLSISGEISGTPQYMAPEQVDHHNFGKIGPWTDVYGLAATLFHLLSGQMPYQGQAIGIFTKLVDRSQPIPDPRDFNPEIPDYLAEAIMNAMQRDASLRPQNMEEFIYSLRPPTPTRRVPRRFTGKAKYAVPALIGAGFAGLILYFVYQGFTKKQAIEKAHEVQDIRSSTIQDIRSTINVQRPTPKPTPLPSPSPSPETLSHEDFAEAERIISDKLHNKNYVDTINDCNTFITNYQNHPEIHEIYFLRATAYYILGINAINSNDTNKAKEMLLKTQEDYEKGMNLAPYQKREDLEKLLEKQHRETLRLLKLLSKHNMRRNNRKRRNRNKR